MDFSYTIGSGSRTTGAEDEDWLGYLDLDDSELRLQIDEISGLQLLNMLETSESLDKDFILPALDLVDQPQGNPVVPIQDTFRTDASLSKRDRAPSINRASPISSASDRPPRKKARKARFTTWQNDLLETWLTCHILYPYPQKKEKEDLAAATGLTVGQIQTWFARTRQRKLRPQNDDLLHPSQAVAAPETNILTTRPHDSGYVWPATQSRGGSSARLSVGPGHSSLQAVAPASPQLDFSDREVDSSVWERRCQDSTSPQLDFSNKEVDSSVWERRYQESARACKMNWWLDTLPERTTDYQWDCPPLLDHFAYSTETSTSVGSVNASSSPLECKAAFPLLLPPTSTFSRSAYQCSPVSIRARDYMSASGSSLGSNNVLSCQQSSWGSGNMSATSAKTYATSRTSYSFSRRRGRRMLSRRRSPSPKKRKTRHSRRSRSPSPNEVNTGCSKSQSPLPEDSNKVPWSKEWKYCCTFCTERFHDRYRWKRHEESRHAPQKSWVCKPVRPFQDRPPLCPLCHFTQGRTEQCLHDMQPCWSKPEMNRTFYRKDNLVQHLEGVHNARASITSALIDELTEGIRCVPYDLTCHFCEHESATWQDRANHIAAHFESGMTMADWKAPEAGSGELLIMDQMKPFIPRLSRLWETSGKEPTDGVRQKLQLRTPSPIPASHQPHLPRILIEDYSAMHKDSIMQDQIIKPSKPQISQSNRKFRFKSVKQPKSFKDKLRKVFR